MSNAILTTSILTMQMNRLQALSNVLENLQVSHSQMSLLAKTVRVECLIDLEAF